MHQTKHINTIFGKAKQFCRPELIDKTILHIFQRIDKTIAIKNTAINNKNNYHPSNDLTTTEILYQKICISCQKTLIFSPHFTKTDLGLLLLTLESKVSWQELKNGDLTEGQWIMLGLAMGRISAMEIFLNYSKLANKCNILTNCHWLKKRNDISQVIFYLGDLCFHNKMFSYQRLKKIAKLINHRLDLPVIIFSNHGQSQIMVTNFSRSGCERRILSRDSTAAPEEPDRECLLEYLSSYTGVNDKAEWEDGRW